MAERITGIYCIRNTVSGDEHDCYVGQSANIERRWRAHCDTLRRGVNSKYLQRAWNKYGAGAFEWTILALCEPDELTRLEQYFTDLLNPNYSLCKQCVTTSLGVKRDAKFRARRAELMRGNHLTLGWHPGPETRAKLSAIMVGNHYSRGTHHPRSSEYIAKQSSVQRASWEDPEIRARRVGAMNSPEGHRRRSEAHQKPWSAAKAFSMALAYAHRSAQLEVFRQAMFRGGQDAQK